MAIQTGYASWTGCFDSSERGSELPIALKANKSQDGKAAARLTRRQLEDELASVADPRRAANVSWFFKTGTGQYGEGDQFLGITVPLQRKISLRYRKLPFTSLTRVLRSRFHEHRFAALEILVAQFEADDDQVQERIVELYLQDVKGINN